MSLRSGRAMLMVAVFTVAILHASACSAACLVGPCRSLVQGLGESGCHHESPAKTSQPAGHDSKHSHCNNHVHPGNFLQGPGGPALGLFAKSWPRTHYVPAAAIPSLVWSPSGASARDHAPPLLSSESLFRKSCLLRI